MFYYSFFYHLYQFINLFSKRAPYHTSVLISGLEIILVVQGYMWLDIILGLNLVIENLMWLIVPIAFLIAIINYHVFLKKERWQLKTKKINKYSSRNKILIGSIIWFAVLFIITGLIVAIKLA